MAKRPNTKDALTARDLNDLRRVRGKLTQKEFVTVVKTLYAAPVAAKGAPEQWTLGSKLAHWAQIEVRKRRSNLSTTEACRWLAREIKDHVIGRTTAARTLRSIHADVVRAIATDVNLRNTAEFLVTALQEIVSKEGPLQSKGYVLIPSTLKPAKSGK